MERARVLLADDHVLLLDAFEKLLERHCDIVGKVTDGRALLEAAARTRPDVVVLDISMPLLNGLDAGEQLKRQMPEVKLVYLTVNEDADIAAEAFRIGASGYLLKSSAASELFQAIGDVLQGRQYITPLATQEIVGALMRSPQPTRAIRRLTPRQREVLQLLAEGHSMKSAGLILSLTPRTVAFHKYRMMEQLGIKTNSELIQFAVNEGIVTGGAE
jgi:DNA-binding NarL/FixJ family response regulator